MFTGIIESTGKVASINQQGKNLRISVASELTPELNIDQSVSHNGVCLTVVDKEIGVYHVDAVEETLIKSNLGDLKVGDALNLERCMLMNGRLDGHIVQGHVDQTGVCTGIESADGSWYFKFSYQASKSQLIVEKGSICVNGISLTAFDVTDTAFTVAIIPYTYEHTNMKNLKYGDRVNLEFDIVGKYIARLASFDE